MSILITGLAYYNFLCFSSYVINLIPVCWSADLRVCYVLTYNTNC